MVHNAGRGGSNGRRSGGARRVHLRATKRRLSFDAHPSGRAKLTDYGRSTSSLHSRFNESVTEIYI